MSDRKYFRWATTGARLIAGTIVAAAFGAGVVTAVTLPWPLLSQEPVSVKSAPLASTTVLSCVGDLLAVGRNPLDPGSLASAQAQSVLVGAAASASAPDESRLASAELPSGPVSVTAQPTGRERADVAAAGSAAVHEDDLTGFAASACRPALLESWLVGGAGTTGAADLVLIANPGSVPAAVELTLFGSHGASTPPGGSVVVPPRTQTAIPLSGLARGEEAPVIRVSSTGAPVQAALQTSILRTLVPGGVDQVGAIAAAAEAQVFPGVAVTQDPAALGAGEDAAVLRLLSPAERGTARITISPIDSSAPAVDPIDVPLGPAVPVDVSLGELPIGRYTVKVEASTPVVSAVWQSSGVTADDDFAWLTPAPAVSEQTVVAVPSGIDPVLVLTNDGAQRMTVAVAAVHGGFSTEVEIAPGRTVPVDVPARAVYSIDPGDGTVRASVSFASAGAMAAFPVWPTDAAAPSVRVYP